MPSDNPPDRALSLEKLRRAPKVELHVHLEGSIRPETLLELARRNSVDLPADDVEGLRRWFVYSGFERFIEVYITITRSLRTVEDYELIVRDFGAEMARQNVRHAEATFSPGTHRLFGVASDVFLEGLRRGRAAVEREHGVSLRWIFDIVRNSDDIRAEGDFVTSLAIEMKGEGVVALGLGGMEAGRPPEPFAPWFERAKSAGLASTPHAGETAGPESVWGAIRALGADRIGHGVRAIEDPALVEHLAERRIPLEICPTSNLRLGVCRSYEEHPMKRLIEAGCVVTIDSDDPPLFNTTLEGEIALMTGPLGLNRFQAREVILNGARCAFLPAESRARLASELGQAGRPR